MACLSGGPGGRQGKEVDDAYLLLLASLALKIDVVQSTRRLVVLQTINGHVSAARRAGARARERLLTLRRHRQRHCRESCLNARWAGAGQGLLGCRVTAALSVAGVFCA